MARFLSKCECCNKRKLLVWKRTFDTKVAGIITSKSHLCGKCAKDIKSKI